MAERQESKWVLRIPFIAEPGFTLEAEREATFAGINAKFRATSFGYTDLIIESLDSEQAARRLFEDVRRGLFAASLTIDWGLRVRGEALTIRGSTPLPNQVEIPMIYRDTQNLSLDPPMVLKAGSRFPRSDAVFTFQEAALTKCSR